MPEKILRKLHLIIRTRLDVIFDKDVSAVSSFNRKGTFDVLPEHSHFISVIEKFVTVHHLDGQKETIKVETGVMHVEENTVKVYLEK
jgi:F0F1-type ATP synthase epsilon subunit